MWCHTGPLIHHTSPARFCSPTYIRIPSFFLSRKLETEGLIHNFLCFCSFWRKSIYSRLLNSSLGINYVWVWKDQYMSFHLHLSEDFYVHLFEFAVQVELPPVKVVGKEGVIVCAAVTGVGQDVAATFGEAEEDVSRRKINSSLMMDSWKYCWQIFTFPAFIIAASSRWLLACWIKRGGIDLNVVKARLTRHWPFFQELLAHNVFQGDTHPGWQLPEEPLWKLASQLKVGEWTKTTHGATRCRVSEINAQRIVFILCLPKVNGPHLLPHPHIPTTDCFGTAAHLQPAQQIASCLWAD